MRILFFLVVLQIPLIKSREKKQASLGGGGGDVAMRWNPKCHDIPLSKNVSGIVAEKKNKINK